MARRTMLLLKGNPRGNLAWVLVEDGEMLSFGKGGLTCYFEHMVVSVFIDIECSKGVVAVVWLHMAGNGLGTIDRNKVCSAINSVDVDNLIMGIPGLDNPHSCFIVRGVINLFEQPDNGARIPDPLIDKPKETENPCNVQIVHPGWQWV